MFQKLFLEILRLVGVIVIFFAVRLYYKNIDILTIQMDVDWL